MRTILDAEALAQWAALALDGMKTHRRAIDALNVFPVPDGDTGTNMYLTLEAGVGAMLESGQGAPAPGSARLATLARGMLLGARGNSGVITSELIRGIAATRATDLDRPMDGAWLADALTRASAAAFSAVSNPKEGTVLTVARAAAEAATEAAEETDGDLQAVTQAAAQAARSSCRVSGPKLLNISRPPGFITRAISAKVWAGAVLHWSEAFANARSTL